jgi:RNA polymerase sigma-70 factor (ECF subfamily)
MGDPSVDLLQRAHQFDVEALASIYDQHNQGIYRYAVRILGDEMLAEDCTAETFHRFLQALQSRHGPREYLQAYLYRIAHNWITDHFRRNRAQDLPLSENMHEGQEEIDLIAHENIEQQRIRALLIRLTPDQRQVILLKYYEGWENNEIAAAIQKPVGAVKALLHRAIKQLQKMAVRQ